MSRLTGPCIIIVAALEMTGCSSMLTSDAPPDTTYWLDPAPIAASAPAESQRLSIQVAVSAAPGLDVNRVLVRGPGAELNAYSAARWPDSIPEVVETLLRTALEDSGRFSRVTSARSGARADWTLDLEVREFYAVSTDVSAPPAIKILLRGYLECQDTVLSIRLGAQRSAQANTLTAITAGFQSGVDGTLAQLVAELPAGCPN